MDGPVRCGRRAPGPRAAGREHASRDRGAVRVDGERSADDLDEVTAMAGPCAHHLDVAPIAREHAGSAERPLRRSRGVPARSIGVPACYPPSRMPSPHWSVNKPDPVPASSMNPLSRPISMLEAHRLLRRIGQHGRWPRFSLCENVLSGTFLASTLEPMTLHEVLDKAAEMQPDVRWRVFQDVCGGNHDPRSLPSVSTGGHPAPPRYCPVCFTAFSPASFRMWNAPHNPAAAGDRLY